MWQTLGKYPREKERERVGNCSEAFENNLSKVSGSCSCSNSLSRLDQVKSCQRKGQEREKQQQIAIKPSWKCQQSRQQAEVAREGREQRERGRNSSTCSQFSVKKKMKQSLSIIKFAGAAKRQLRLTATPIFVTFE